MSDGGYVGRVDGLPGVIAFGDTANGCEAELYSVVEDWARIGVRLGHQVPVIGGVDLNTDEARKLVLD